MRNNPSEKVNAEYVAPKELARAFLYGVSHNLPEYRTALACYYYVKNLPEHEFEKYYIGSSIDGDVYSDSICEVCRYDSELSDDLLFLGR